jgi:hypothetical protein
MFEEKVDFERLKEFREKFVVLDGLPIDEIPPHRIALSLVHPRERIDIAISAISWIEPRRCKFYSWGKIRLFHKVRSSRFVSPRTFVKRFIVCRNKSSEARLISSSTARM